MQIDKAFELLEQFQLVDSQFDFDRRYLKRPCGHVAYLKSTGCRPSSETLLRLFFSLEGQLQDQSKDTGTYLVLDNLANEVWTELEQIASPGAGV